MTTVKTNVIQIDTTPAAKSVKDLRSELKELRDTLLNLDKGTEEYSKTLQQAANIQHELREQTAELNASAMDFGQVTSNMTKTATGLVGAFQSVTALMGMFGVESESAQKAILKLQQSMAIIQGLQAMDEGVKAFKRLGMAIKNSTLFTELFTTATKAKTAATTADTVATNGATVATNAFKAAIISTGIGAIVVAIGVLVANWDKLTDAIGGSTAKLRDWNGEMESINYNLSFQQRLLQAQGASNLEILNSELAGLKQEKDLLDKEFNSLQSKRHMGIKLSNEQMERYNELITLRSRKLDDITVQETKIATEEKKILDKSVEDQKKAEEEKTKAAKAEAEKRKKAIQDEVDAAKKAYDSLVNKYRDTVEKLQIEMNKELIIAGNNEALRLKIIEDYGQKIFLAREKELKDTKQQAYDADLRNLNELYNKKEISSAEYYDRLRKLDAKYMIDWGSYQAAAVARYNQQLIDIRRSFITWQISYQEYSTQINAATQQHYKDLQADSEKFIETKDKEIKGLKEYFRLINSEAGTDILLTEDITDAMQNVGTELRKLYPDILTYTVEEQEKLTKTVIKGLIDSGNAEINAARTTIYQIQDYYIKARESAKNWVDALDTIERRSWDDRVERIKSEYEQELALLEDLKEKQLIEEADYNRAALLLDEKRSVQTLQLYWDMFTEVADIANEAGAAVSSIGNAIQANAEYQIEAGKISEAEYKESIKRAQGYNIAGVVISTLAGIANATASIWSPNNAYLTVWGQAGMQAAITVEMLANMAAQIAQIKRQSLNSYGGVSLSTGAVSSLNAPLQYTNSVEGASKERDTRDTRVYVTEHDITDTQRRVQVAQSEARF